MHIWQNILSEQDNAVIDAAGYARRGASTFASRRNGDRPALLIIDMQKLFVGPDKPILEAIAQSPTMIGEAGWQAIDAMKPLIAHCRAQRVPVVYAKMQPHNRPTDDPLLDIVTPLTPTHDDLVINKQTTSVFFETSLGQILRERDCDSVILVGNSTSGCVRAAAVDAVQHGFGVYVPYDCVFDRIQASHQVALLDMWMKYATVLSSQELITKVAAHAH